MVRTALGTIAVAAPAPTTVRPPAKRPPTPPSTERRLRTSGQAQLGWSQDSRQGRSSQQAWE